VEARTLPGNKGLHDLNGGTRRPPVADIERHGHHSPVGTNENELPVHHTAGDASDHAERRHPAIVEGGDGQFRSVRCTVPDGEQHGRAVRKRNRRLVAQFHSGGIDSRQGLKGSATLTDAEQALQPLGHSGPDDDVAVHTPGAAAFVRNIRERNGRPALQRLFHQLAAVGDEGDPSAVGRPPDRPRASVLGAGNRA
jgi:hypothetical protein